MKKKYGLIALCSIVLITLIYTIYNFEIVPYVSKPSLKLNGSNTITINYNDKYIEKGYVASLNNKNINDKVIIENNIDSSKIGEYFIKYSIKNNKGKNEVTKRRNIIVIDNDKPTINLIGDSVINLYIGNIYNELGYTADDKYDGDITNKVIVNGKIDTNNAGSYLLSYKVKDSSNNEATANRIINVISKPTVLSNKTGIPILMYHFFYDSSIGQTAHDSNYLEINKFEEQIKYLVNNNYYFPTWSELNDYIDNKITLPKKSIIITIDDGAESFFRLAYNVLIKYNVKATSFIVTSWTNLNNANVDRSLINFQSHTHNMHRGGCNTGHGGIFQCIDYNAAIDDLNTSKSILGSSEVLAYPFGDYNNTIINELKDVGFKMAVTTNSGRVVVGSNKYLLPRVRISNNTTLSSFINLIK
jgi:peptidoglycan/xylan/chitin deacetylase (PgdA/CDA1 family)